MVFLRALVPEQSALHARRFIFEEGGGGEGGGGGGVGCFVLLENELPLFYHMHL